MSIIDFFIAFVFIGLVAAVGVLVWYIRTNITFLRAVQESLENTASSIEIYQEHLNKIANLETYYGDNVVEGLMSHTREMAQIMQSDLTEIRSYFDE